MSGSLTLALTVLCKYPALDRAMYDNFEKTLSLEETISFLDKISGETTKNEKNFLEDYCSAPSKENYVESELVSNAVDHGIQLNLYNYTFDMDADPYLADLCPDGVRGQVSLLRFCELFFVILMIYDDSQREFGPYRDKELAEKAFEDVRFWNERW